MLKKYLLKNTKDNLAAHHAEDHAEAFDKIKAHRIGDRSLTIATLVLVAISLYYNMQFAPFIILLMASRIGPSLYIVVKTASKREFRKLLLWLALLGKSVFSCYQYFAFAI